MNYSENSDSVRVDYFKPSGKWYMTEALDMSGYWDEASVYSAVIKSLDDAWNLRHGGRPSAWRQFTIVVLEPSHRNAYPVMIPATNI